VPTLASGVSFSVRHKQRHASHLEFCRCQHVQPLHSTCSPFQVSQQPSQTSRGLSHLIVRQKFVLRCRMKWFWPYTFVAVSVIGFVYLVLTGRFLTRLAPVILGASFVFLVAGFTIEARYGVKYRIRPGE
jgi:hypothetical protein